MSSMITEQQALLDAVRKPYDTVRITVGQIKLDLPVKPDKDDHVARRFYQIEITKAALENQPTLTWALRLSTLGQHCGAPLFADLHGDALKSMLSVAFNDPSAITAITAVLNSKGEEIADALDSNGHLKTAPPASAANSANFDEAVHRPSDCSYVRVQAAIGLKTFATDDNGNPVKVPVSWMIELPHSTIQIKDENGDDVDYVGYIGDGDLSGMPFEDFQADILGVTHQAEPRWITPATLAATSISAATDNLKNTILDILIRETWTHIVDKIKNYIASGYTDRPDQLFDHHTQTLVDAKGNSKIQSVHTYISGIIDSAQLYRTQGFAPKCLVSHALDNFDPKYRDEIRSRFGPIPAKLSRRLQVQLRELLRLKEIATEVESSVNSLVKTVLSNHAATLAAAAFRSGAGDGSKVSAKTLASFNADKTIANYKQDDGDSTRTLPRNGFSLQEFGGRAGFQYGHCIICNDPDHTADTCPEKDTPEGRLIFEENLPALRKGLRANPRSYGRRNDRRSSSARGKRARANFVKDLSPKEASALRRELAKKSKTSSTSSSPSPLILIAHVCNSQALVGTVDIPIDGNLPSIIIPLAISESDNIGLRVCVDSGSAISLLHAAYGLDFFEAYPALVKNLYFNQDVSISGINAHAIDTSSKVPVVAELKTAWKISHDNGRTFNDVTIRFGLSSGLSVKCILGNPALKSMKATLSFADNVLETSNLDVDAIPLEFAPPDVPSACNLPKCSLADRDRHSEILTKILHARSVLGLPPKPQAPSAPSSNLAFGLTQSPLALMHALAAASPSGVPSGEPKPVANDSTADLTAGKTAVLASLGLNHSTHSGSPRLTADEWSRFAKVAPLLANNNVTIHSDNQGVQSIDGATDTPNTSARDENGLLAGSKRKVTFTTPVASKIAATNSQVGSPSARRPLLDSGASGMLSGLPFGLLGQADPELALPRPIKPVRRVIRGRKRHQRHVLFDNRGFDDPQDDFENMLPDTSAHLIRRRKHPPRQLADIDPSFIHPYNEAKHRPYLREHLDIAHLPAHQQQAVENLVIKYFPVFNPDGLAVPIRDYTCVIDTGDHPPIAVKNATYGPNETPIIEREIAKLVKLGMAYQIFDSEWLFKGLLAPKPHQEHVTDISNFKWRFCVSYVKLNAITRLITFPIPRCDDAVHVAIGSAKYMILADCPSGFHQIKVDPKSRHKLAFAGPNATKYTYRVMPFGIVNGPAIFIIMIHDLDGTWKEVARTRGVTIGRDTNTRIIVDDIFAFAPTFEIAMSLFECILQVCMTQNLSLSLPKTSFFANRLEFVGIDVSLDGNRPAQSKHKLLQTWPKPDTVRDVAAFVGFILFYAQFIPHAEIRMANLRELLTLDMDVPLNSKWTSAHEAERTDMLQAILDDPCLARFDPARRPYLRTDFSGIGMGYVLLQPDDNEESLAAMNREMEGGECEFATTDTTLRLRPCAFGSRRSRGRENMLHSHLGEAFALDWAINRNRHRLFALAFTAITDNYALKFIFSYEGANPVILRLLMRLSCWNMKLVHRNAQHVGDADFMSRCGEDLNFDPLCTQYLNYMSELRRRRPPITGQMKPENMPNYRPPRRHATANSTFTQAQIDFRDDTHALQVLSTIADQPSFHRQPITNVPVLFGHSSPDELPSNLGAELHHSAYPALASTAASIQIAVYGFTSGHFIDSFEAAPIQVDLVLAIDPSREGRSMFSSTTSCPMILESSRSMLNHITSTTVTSDIHLYLIHSPRNRAKQLQQQFWTLQSSIINQLRLKRNLSMIAIHLPSTCDMHQSTTFESDLEERGWLFTKSDIYYPTAGDSIDDSAIFAVGVHNNSMVGASRLHLIQPPSTAGRPLGQFVHAPFNSSEYSVSPSPQNADFQHSFIRSRHPVTAPPAHAKLSARRLYNLYRPTDDENSEQGSGVFSLDGLCPPICLPNDNLFKSSCGIEFSVQRLTDNSTPTNETLVRPLSPFEHVSAFGLPRNLTYQLSHATTFSLLDGAIPSRTSKWFLRQLIDRLQLVTSQQIEILDDTATHAAAALVPVFLNGAVGASLPDDRAWAQAYQDDDETKLLIDMARDRSLADDKQLMAKLHYIYRQPVRNGDIIFETGQLYLIERFRNDTKYVKLRIVPKSLQHAIFVAFHANPIGGHLSASRTFSRIRIRYFWPHMYKFINKMISTCPACRLKNSTIRRDSELVYGFPIDAPMRVLHVDIYSVGTEFGFDDDRYYLIAACGMTAFAVCEPTAEANAKSFASALMKIYLRFGFSHTVIVDKDSKFRGTFAQMIELLNINMHVLSGENHDPMLVERIGRYLNESLRILIAEREDPRVALEAIHLSLYAWNSAPIVGTDISRSLLVVGREFSFPIDFSSGNHYNLTTTASSVENYARDLASRLTHCRAVATTLIDHHRAYHREYINSKRPNPTVYSAGDRVFVRRSVKSNKTRGIIGKIALKWNGPWEIIERAHGASYRLRHMVTGQIDKKHASFLSPFPDELVPLLPIDGSDMRYSQLNKPVQKNPFVEASIKGYEPFQPFAEDIQATSLHLLAETSAPIHFPTLAELNHELLAADDSLSPEDLQFDDDDDNAHIECAALSATTPRRAIPDLGQLTARIVKSSDKLFFIAHRHPGTTSSEWSLVRINLEDSLSLHPTGLQDGKLLADFLLCHPRDKHYNAINQRFWLEYHVADPSSANSTRIHLIKPQPGACTIAARHGARLFRQWINITSSDTYLHGPFDFATLHGQKTDDRIALDDWKNLHSLVPHRLFTNAPPSLDLPTYSVHISRVHSTFRCETLSTRFLSTGPCASRP